MTFLLGAVSCFLLLVAVAATWKETSLSAVIIALTFGVLALACAWCAWCAGYIGG